MTDSLPARLREVQVHALDPARYEPLVGVERMRRFEGIADATRRALGGRSVLNVNSTAVGGGVAEMLQTLLSYARGAGVDTRWLVIAGGPEFFVVTKRVHNGIYGTPGDGGPLGERERREYEQVARANSHELLAVVAPGDVVVLHDPQTAGLVAPLQQAGALVVWRCHIGSDQPNEWTERAWGFLRPYVESADWLVVSRRAFAPTWFDPDRVTVIPPSIDPFSAKNEPMSSRNVRLALGYVGLLEGSAAPPVVPFTRRDGSPGRVTRRADVVQAGPPPPAGAPLVLQVSRWDTLKDMAGVMEGFAYHVDFALGAHLVLAGPAVTGVADDPAAAAVYDDCLTRWRALPHALRSRIHLACTPMTDPDEAAAIVNALQRQAAVVVQKSLAEGFGLTVAEAMWKGRPVVGTAVGGIVDQITDGETGVLLDHPDDLRGFGAAVEGLIRDPGRAEELGRKGRERVVEEFLGDRHLEHYAAVFAEVLGDADLAAKCRAQPSAGEAHRTAVP